MEELKLIYTHKGGPYGDCMSSYDVSFNRTCSLGEFIDAILKRNEWGTIRIGSFSDRDLLPELEYKYGLIVKSEFSEKDLRKEVQSVYASYGWTCGNYWVKISNP